LIFCFFPASFFSPMGVFEFSNFSEGTKAVGRAVAEATKNGAVSIIGQFVVLLFCCCFVVCFVVLISPFLFIQIAQVEVILPLLLPNLAWRTRSATAALEAVPAWNCLRARISQESLPSLLAAPFKMSPLLVVASKEEYQKWKGKEEERHVANELWKEFSPSFFFGLYLFCFVFCSFLFFLFLFFFVWRMLSSSRRSHTHARSASASSSASSSPLSPASHHRREMTSSTLWSLGQDPLGWSFLGKVRRRSLRFRDTRGDDLTNNPFPSSSPFSPPPPSPQCMIL